MSRAEFSYEQWLSVHDLVPLPEDVAKGLLSPRQLLRNRRAARVRRKGEKAKAEHLAFLSEMTVDQAIRPTWRHGGPDAPPALLARARQDQDDQYKAATGKWPERKR